MFYFIAAIVKAKLKSIRTIYTRERQKATQRKSGSGLDDVYTSKFPHYDRLQFLNDFVGAKRGIFNMKVSIASKGNILMKIVFLSL